MSWDNAGSNSWGGGVEATTFEQPQVDGGDLAFNDGQGEAEAAGSHHGGGNDGACFNCGEQG